ncbi:hypothetical protein Bca4012_093440 [Brassica carinata]
MNTTKTDMFTSGVANLKQQVCSTDDQDHRALLVVVSKAHVLCGQIASPQDCHLWHSQLWILAFILPKGCIENIESLCSRFLWSGSIENSKIAWTTVCLPKEEGGLGLRSFSTWNQVLCLKFIWTLLSKSPSLWVDWHWSAHLNGQSFWNITASATDSLAWRKLLDLRPLTLQFIRTRLGNGLATSFWYDVWTPVGQLITHIGPSGPRSPQVRKQAVVADAIRNSVWSLPHPRSQQEVDLHAHLTTINLPLDVDVIDEYEWVAGNSPIRVFRSSTTWEVLRPRNDIQDWVDVVWFKGAIPKHSFTTLQKKLLFIAHCYSTFH